MFVVSLCFLLAAVFNQSEGDIRCPNGEDIAVSMFSDCQREILNIVELMCSLFAPDSNSNTTGFISSTNERASITEELVCNCCMDDCSVTELTKYCRLLNHKS